MGAREPHVASGGPLLWRPRLGLSGRAAPCVLKPPGTPDSRLGTAGPGDRSRRAAVTERCSHEGAASARPQSLAPGTVAIPEGQSQGQPPQSEVRGAQGPRLALRSRPPRRPFLACLPYLSGGGNPTRTGAGLEEGRCARTEMGGPPLPFVTDCSRRWDEGVTVPVTLLPA